MCNSHRKSEFLIRAFVYLFIAIVLLVGLPACASVEDLPEPQDPQIAALQQELDRITRLNTTTQQRVEDIYNRVFALQAKVDSLEERLDEIEPTETTLKVKPVPKKAVHIAKVKKASVSPKLSPGRQYERAYRAYTKQYFDEAMALFKKFLESYPKHDLADNAQYWIGEIYYDMDDYPNAILAFKEVTAHYPERSKAPDALLKIGYSYVALDDLVNARIYLKRVIKDYPFSEAKAKARAKLKELE